jgi:hypothetical protein
MHIYSGTYIYIFIYSKALLTQCAAARTPSPPLTLPSKKSGSEQMDHTHNTGNQIRTIHKIRRARRAEIVVCVSWS